MSHIESVAQGKSHYFFLAEYKPTSKMLIHGFMDIFAQKNDHLKKNSILANKTKSAS